MASNTIEKDKPKKFLFGTHIFDEPEEEEIEEAPPPPTYSEEELEAAKQAAAKEAFAKGREEASREAAESREQHIATVLKSISQDVEKILDAEQSREKAYERESVKLSQTIFKKLFPFFFEKHGFAELTDILEKVIIKQENQEKITIEVPPDTQEGIQAFLDKTFASAGAGKLKVIANEHLEKGGCTLSWKDGGMVRNTVAIADEVVRLMEEALAGEPTNVHDNDEIEKQAEEKGNNAEATDE